MSGESVHIYDPEDLLICEPFSRRGKDALERIKSKVIDHVLTKDDFYTHLYTEPFFIDPGGYVPVNVDEKEEENKNDFSLSPKGIDYSELKSRKQKFESHFLHEATDPLLHIRGSSGSGKTIYLNKLLCEWIKQNNDRTDDVNIIEINLEDSASETVKGNVIFPEKNKSLATDNGVSNARRFFLVQLLDRTFDTIWEIRNTMDAGKAANIKANFRNFFGINILNKMKDSLDIILQPKSDNFETERILAGHLFQNIIDYCVDYNNTILSIMNTLKLFTRFLLCNADWKKKKQTLIVFDSIEHYIDVKTRIYDADIKDIVDAVHQFTEDEKNYYKKMGLVFAACFKVVMVIRDTTDKMFSVSVHNHFSEYVDSSINVTRWYDTNEIFAKKMNYIKFINPDPTLKILALLLKDKSKFNASIMDLVSSMYNYNKRRISGILTRVAGYLWNIKEHPDKNQKVMDFDLYVEYWKKNNIIYKYMLRRSILRIIMNLIKTTDYFKFISTMKDTSSNITDKQTYTRRVLTCLSRVGNEKKEYMGFKELITKVLQVPTVQGKMIDKEQIEGLAKILVALDEFRFDSNHDEGQPRSHEVKPNKWCQLVVIKFNDADFNIDALSQKMWDEYLSESPETDKYGVKITDAGRFFIYIQCDFEYFACRYAESNTPLLLIRDLATIKETIKCVFKRAKECIDHVILKEYFFTNNNFRALDNRDYHYYYSNKELPFPYRIIKNHRQYLFQYREIIKQENKVYLSKEEDDELVAFIDTYTEKYGNIFTQLKENTYTVKGIPGEVRNYFRPDFEGSL